MSSTANATAANGTSVNGPLDHEHEEIKHDPDYLPPCKNPAYIKNSVTKLICQRHSTRSFLPKPVPSIVLEEVLSLAQHAPSNSNIQPWRVHILSGNALKRLSDKLVDKVIKGEKPVTAPLPEEYRKYRSELGHQLYGPEGYNVPRTDKEATQKAQLRNYHFFHAPVAAIACMDKKLEDIDALGIGMYLQTICLLLAERGLGTCVAVSVVGYPDVIREELGLPEGLDPLTGLAIGYEDETNLVNRMRVKRDAWKDSVFFKSD